jgi:dTDP-4-dehydrorhamnose reductase
MKILILGRGGQVADALCVTAPVNSQIVAKARQEVDITDRAVTLAAIARERPDIVINAAAYTAVDRAETETGMAYQVNADAVGSLSDICLTYGSKLVHFSTDFVFDGNSSTPYRIDDATAPLNVYGASKRAGEIAALANSHNLVIRTAWVYSVVGHNFVKTMLRLMAERDVIQVVDDQVGTPTHARSLAEATWDLVTSGTNGLHHFTDAGVASWYDFAVAIQEESAALGLLTPDTRVLAINSLQYPTPARRPPFGVLDKSVTWQLLDKSANHWRTELRHMLTLMKGL